MPIKLFDTILQTNLKIITAKHTVFSNKITNTLANQSSNVSWIFSVVHNI